MRDVTVLIKNSVDINASLEVLKNTQKYNETLDNVLKNWETINEKIKKAKEVYNLEDYANYSKEIKDDAKKIGFAKLADIAVKHEINARTKDLEYIMRHFTILIEELENSINIAKEYQQSNIEITESSKIDANKILVVDDSNFVRKLINKMVNDDYEILNAGDGQEAIDILKKEKEGLIGMLLDLNMPNVNGFQVLEYLDKNELFEKISVAVITGDDSKENVLKAFDYPIVDVLAKPFNDRDVKRVITAMLTHK